MCACVWAVGRREPDLGVRVLRCSRRRVCVCQQEASAVVCRSVCPSCDRQCLPGHQPACMHRRSPPISRGRRSQLAVALSLPACLPACPPHPLPLSACAHLSPPSRRCTGALSPPAFRCLSVGVSASQNGHPKRPPPPQTPANTDVPPSTRRPSAPLTRLLGYRRTAARRGPPRGADR